MYPMLRVVYEECVVHPDPSPHVHGGRSRDPPLLLFVMSFVNSPFLDFFVIMEFRDVEVEVTSEIGT